MQWSSAAFPQHCSLRVTPPVARFGFPPLDSFASTRQSSLGDAIAVLAPDMVLGGDTDHRPLPPMVDNIATRSSSLGDDEPLIPIVMDRLEPADPDEPAVEEAHPSSMKGSSFLEHSELA